MSLEVGICLRGVSVLRNRQTGTNRKRSSLNSGDSDPFLDQIDLDLKRGDKVLLQGKSSRPKKALIRVLAGMLPPCSGSVVLQGKALPGVDPTFCMMPRATLYQNAVLRGMKLGLSGDGLSAYIRVVFENTDLEKHKNFNLIDLNQDISTVFWLETLDRVTVDILLLESWMNPASRELNKRCRQLFRRLVNDSEIAVIAVNNTSLAEKECNMDIEFEGSSINSIKRTGEI